MSRFAPGGMRDDYVFSISNSPARRRSRVVGDVYAWRFATTGGKDAWKCLRWAERQVRLEELGVPDMEA